MIKIPQLLIAAFLLTSCVSPSGIPVVETNMEPQVKLADLQLSVEGDIPSLDGATLWLNTKPLTAADLRGKVVLVQFWTYTCINWLRTAPYVRAWAEKYKDKGLVVIGVHTPEFAFEKDVGNVRREVKDMNITYPVALDSDYRVWRAFDNHYWPALYFVDAKGQIRHHHFGEGEYEQSERVIQQLLAEAGAKDVANDLAKVSPQGIEAAADWEHLRSPENYLGYERSSTFAPRGGTIRDRSNVYSPPAQLALNEWSLAGDWTVSQGSVLLNKAGGTIVYRFHARDVNLVVGPAKPGAAVRFRLTIDGKPPGGSQGSDVDEQGNGTINEQRLYQLVRQPLPIDDRQFEIEFLDAGAEVFAFTFG